MAGFVMKERDIQHIFEVSSLLQVGIVCCGLWGRVRHRVSLSCLCPAQTAEMKKLKEKGVLIGDRCGWVPVVSSVFVPCRWFCP